jgi:hypothetical protein
LRNDAPLSDFFNLFIDDDDFALMATETNRYYSQIRLRNGENVKPNARMNLWYETSANEIKQFLGLTLALYPHQWQYVVLNLRCKVSSKLCTLNNGL